MNHLIKSIFIVIILIAPCIASDCKVPGSEPWYKHKPCCSMYQSNSPILTEAKKIKSGKYKKNATMDDAKKGIYNCTTFMQQTLDNSKINLTTKMKTRIQISDLLSKKEITGLLSKEETASLTKREKKDLTEKRIKTLAKKKIIKLVEKDDDKIKGVARALIESGNGKAVNNREDIKPGDVIQMWRKKSDGSYGGHTGVIEGTDGSTISLYGAHRSKEGVDTQTYNLKNWSKTYVARPNKK